MEVLSTFLTVEQVPALPFTDREREIAKRLAEGKKRQVIANELFVSLYTIQTQMHKAFVRHGVDSSAQFVALAFRQGEIA